MEMDELATQVCVHKRARGYDDAINPPIVIALAPNGVRYPRVGGTRQCHFAGTNLEPRKLLENAATPTRRVHAVLARF